MSNVLPFIAKLAADGDWSGSERAWLMELAGRLSPTSPDMEVVFGQSDEGEPWCVVLDPAGEVLVHVARVGGQFILHHLPDDGVQQGADLATALRRFMGADWNGGRGGEVVQLNANGRQAKTIVSLIVATAFYYATADAEDLALGGGHVSDAPADTPTVPPSLAGAPNRADHPAKVAATPHAPEAKAEAPAHVASEHVAAEAAVAPPVATSHPVEVAAAGPPLPSASSLVAEAPKTATHGLIAASVERIVGGPGNDHLVGGPGPSVLIGGAGNDTLDGGGAPAGKIDLLIGGPGNDRIIMSANAVAIGGPGADTFVVGSEPAHPHAADAGAASPAVSLAATQAPTPTPTPTQTTTTTSTALGVILDFHQSEGDQLVAANGGKVVVLNTTLETDVLAQLHQQPGLQGFGATPGERVEVDLDGDGKVDGYLLIAPGDAVTISTAPAHAPEAAGAAPLVGVAPAASVEAF